MYVYHDNQGVVAMRSEKPLTKYGNLIEKKILINEPDKENLDGHIIRISNDKLEFEKMPRVKDGERTIVKEELRVKAQNNTLEIKDILNFILD